MPVKGALCVLFLAFSLSFATAAHATTQTSTLSTAGAAAPPAEAPPDQPSPGFTARTFMPMLASSVYLTVEANISANQVHPGENVRISSNITNLSSDALSTNIVLRITGPNGAAVQEQAWSGQSFSPHELRSIAADFAPAPTLPDGRYVVELKITCAVTGRFYFHPRTIAAIELHRDPTGPGDSGLYWGIAMKDIPWDMGKLDAWEKSAGKAVSIVHFWTFWNQGGTMQKFQSALASRIRDHGAIPMVSWPSEKMSGGANQPDYRLAEIIKGRYDDYIRQWAVDARNWGHPFFLRYGHEMNGPFYAWSEDANSNKRGEFVQAWRHIHDIFAEVGARNVSWVWCPNVDFPGSPYPTVRSLYPGDDYVDWTCMDGYNWGEGSRNGWQTFDQVYRHTYGNILQVAPGKPMMVGEVGCSTDGDKPGWVRDAIGTAVPSTFPALKAVVWYNWQFDGEDWRIESSSASLAAFREKIASPIYLANQFGALTSSPIPARR